MIALGRLALAVFFLVATRYGMEGPPSYPAATFLLAGLYLLIATVLLAIAWSSWWLDYRLKLASHLLDIALFVSLDLSTGLSVASPFFVFFVFLVLSAAARWGWRHALLTAVAATFVFAFETLIALQREAMQGDDYVRMIVRGGHLLVLSLMIAWFGMTLLSSRYETDGFELEPGAVDPPIRRALEHMAKCLGAERATLIWWEEEEPWIHLATLSAGGRFETERLGPEDLGWTVAEDLMDRTFLFDVARRHVLLPLGGRLTARRNVNMLDPALAARLDIGGGLATPLQSELLRGVFLLSGIDGMCRDDLPIARKAALDIARAFDRLGALRASMEATEGRTRLGVARDLHDSLAQILAGIGMKLRAARNVADPAQRDRELQAIEGELADYQRYIHAYIDELRNPASDSLRVDLEARLSELAGALRRQWQVEVDYAGDHVGAVSRGLEVELNHLVREAVANAARHGKADRVRLSAALDGGNVVLRCEDNGAGFTAKGTFTDAELDEADIFPRSIVERVRTLGGAVSLVSRDEGAIVEISLPVRTVEQ